MARFGLTVLFLAGLIFTVLVLFGRSLVRTRITGGILFTRLGFVLGLICAVRFGFVLRISRLIVAVAWLGFLRLAIRIFCGGLSGPARLVGGPFGLGLVFGIRIVSGVSLFDLGLLLLTVLFQLLSDFVSLGGRGDLDLHTWRDGSVAMRLLVVSSFDPVEDLVTGLQTRGGELVEVEIVRPFESGSFVVEQSGVQHFFAPFLDAQGDEPE